jgi:ribosomal protein S9
MKQEHFTLMGKRKTSVSGESFKRGSAIKVNNKLLKTFFQELEKNANY